MLTNENGIPILLGQIMLIDVHTGSCGYAPLYANLEVWVVGNARCPVYWEKLDNLKPLIPGIHAWERSLPPEEPSMKYKVQGISILPGMLVFMEMEIKDDSRLFLVGNVVYKENLDEETKAYCLAVRAGLYEKCEVIPNPEQPPEGGVREET